MTEPALLAQLVDATQSYTKWSILGEALRRGSQVHLAVMVEPYLSYILDGKKSIESRFSKNAIAPYLQIESDDLVLLKLTGGPVVGCFTTDSVEFVTLSELEFERLRINYSDAICADDNFWQARLGKRYATLIGVREPLELPPVSVAKSDRRGWVTLAPDLADGGEQLALL
jgi:ASCH domain